MKYKTIIGTNTYKPYYTNEEGITNILLQWLESVYNNTDMKDAHVIVANNSEDPEMIRDITGLCIKYQIKYQNLTLINFKKNLGTSAAWNIIARLYDNDITVILNDDIMVYPYWLEATKYVLENNPAIGTLSYDLWYTKKPFEFIVPQEARIWANESIYPLGAAFAFRKKVFDKIGGFDEQFFMGLEEADFGVRLVKAGYFNYIIGTVGSEGRNDYHFMRHIGSASGGYISDSGEKWARKHNLSFPLNPEIEETLKKDRGNKIEVRLPYIKDGRVLW